LFTSVIIFCKRLITLSFYLLLPFPPPLCLLDGLAAGLLFGLVAGFAEGLLAGLVLGFVDGLLAGLVLGFVDGLLAGLVLGFVEGLLAGLVLGFVFFEGRFDALLRLYFPSLLFLFTVFDVFLVLL
jgi:hypothetical protein